MKTTTPSNEHLFFISKRTHRTNVKSNELLCYLQIFEKIQEQN